MGRLRKRGRDNMGRNREICKQTDGEKIKWVMRVKASRRKVRGVGQIMKTGKEKERREEGEEKISG